MLPPVGVWGAMPPKKQARQGLIVRPADARPQSIAGRLLVVVLFVAGASLVRAFYHWATDGSLVFAAFYPVILLATLMYGAGMGVVAILLSMSVAWFAFMPPEYSFMLPAWPRSWLS